ncbi:MAG: HgcAB-like fusion protein [Candidatus Binatia bacterium]
MSGLWNFLLDALQTGFRLFPWPTEPGLRPIGQPNRESPVLLTCNFDLTVRRLERALRGLDLWLVVAPSRGINVWCASSGGILTTAQAVTALKTCGVADKVNHKRVVLPQLAATGVESRELSRRSGWKARFGPVYAQDIPRYLASGGQKSDGMRRVRFGFRERLEMAVAWAVPMSLAASALAAWLQPSWVIPIDTMIVTLSLAVFLGIDRLPEPRRALAWLITTPFSVAAVALCGGGGVALMAALVVHSVALALLTFDYSGSTPVEGGSHFAEKNWTITLDSERCEGIYTCWAVCPEACFEKVEGERRVELAHDERCVKCGACVVQCPEDALFFSDRNGASIPPSTIRRYKLNLLGSRKLRPA